MQPWPLLVDNVKWYMSSTSQSKKTGWKSELLSGWEYKKEETIHTQTQASNQLREQSKLETNKQGVWCQFQMKVSRWCEVCTAKSAAKQKCENVCKKTTNPFYISRTTHFWCPMEWKSPCRCMIWTWPKFDSFLKNVTIFKLIHKSNREKQWCNTHNFGSQCIPQHYVLVITLQFTYLNKKKLFPWL